MANWNKSEGKIVKMNTNNSNPKKMESEKKEEAVVAKKKAVVAKKKAVVAKKAPVAKKAVVAKKEAPVAKEAKKKAPVATGEYPYKVKKMKEIEEAKKNFEKGDKITFIDYKTKKETEGLIVSHSKFSDGYPGASISTVVDGKKKNKLISYLNIKKK
ncbi:hypothetical protein Phi3:1_gp55 [Cellulophaga phage phi3:1]|nr:hypothetical protein Phi3:1_gp55 [Cellulophaga phage phi3:1]